MTSKIKNVITDEYDNGVIHYQVNYKSGRVERFGNWQKSPKTVLNFIANNEVTYTYRNDRDTYTHNVYGEF